MKEALVMKAVLVKVVVLKKTILLCIGPMRENTLQH